LGQDLAFKLTTITNCCPVSIIKISNKQVQIKWDCGILQSAPNANGPFTDVPGSPTSPYTTTTQFAPPHTFYRTKCN
jgi:hypothetical protein